MDADVMDGLDKLSYDSINRYFHILSVLGYKSYKETNKLIVLLLIEDLLRSSFSLYINEEDYKVIVNVLYCLFGATCLIPYPEFAVSTSLVQNLNDVTPRIAENEILRFSESELIRIVNE